MTVGQIARIVGGRVIGKAGTSLKRVTALEEADRGSLSFYFGNDPHIKTAAACVVASIPLATVPSQILVADPRRAMFRLLTAVDSGILTLGTMRRTRARTRRRLGRGAIVAPSAVMGTNVQIGCLSYVGPHVRIGNHVVIGPNVTIGDNVKIGNRVFIQSGAVIGSQGFGYIKQDGRYRRIPHIGSVQIGDDVDIGANVTIDRGTIGDTVIGRGSKIDNLVHVGHNVKIGQDCIIVAQVGLSGSVRLGRDVILAGQVGIKDGVDIGDGSIIYAKSAVFKSVPKGAVYSGIPARDHFQTMRAYARLFREAEDDRPDPNAGRPRSLGKKKPR